MAKFVFGMNQSLDGYVDHREMRAGPALFRHWIDQSATSPAVYTVAACTRFMRYWDEDSPEWGAEHESSRRAWRRQPKWVVSRSFDVGRPNATLVDGDIEAAMRSLKARLVGEIAVSGPQLARKPDRPWSCR